MENEGTASSPVPEAFTFEELKVKALELGWNDMGIAPAHIPDVEVQSYEKWLQSGYQSGLEYMEKRMRCHPTDFFAGAKSAIVFVSYYKQPKVDFQKGQGVVASYARGRDYHHVHRKRLKKFIAWLENRCGQVGIAKGFSDSAPVMEKALAVQAGLGWFGKNSLLIHRRFGTFTLLSGLMTTLELPLDTPTLDLRLPRCGTCTRCIDACPVQALHTPYVLDARRCLSYHLIESKKDIPADIAAKNPGYVFGCDICQDVCPHNMRKPNAETPDFSPQAGLGAILTLQDIESLQQQPERLYGTPLKRRTAEGLKHTFMLLPE